MNRTLPHLTSLRDDPTAPAQVRAAVGDWLDRLDLADRTLAEQTHALTLANRTVADTLRTAPTTVVAMLAAGKLHLDKIAPKLDEQRATAQTALDRLAIMRSARNACEHGAVTVLSTYAVELLPWVAAQRVAVILTDPVPQYVAAIAERIATRVVMPTESRYDDSAGNGVVMLRPAHRVGVKPGDRTSLWAWCAIHTGQYVTTTDASDRPVARITAEWSRRDELIAQMPEPRRAPEPAPRRRAPRANSTRA